MLVMPAGRLLRPGQLKLSQAAPHTEPGPCAPPRLLRPPLLPLGPLGPLVSPATCVTVAAAGDGAGGRVMSRVGAAKLRRSQSFTVPSMSLLLTRLLPS